MNVSTPRRAIRARPGRAAIITLTTDFGPTEYVAAMKGVILGINPEATIVDILHRVPAQNVRHGAYALYSAAPFFPSGVHVGVVDPGVGTERRPIAIDCADGVFVGPDNGLLVPAAARAGIREARHITNREFLRTDVSDTFHGRDVFAPTAAHLTLGVRARDLGPKLDEFVRLDFGTPNVVGDDVSGIVLIVDTFGNLVTNIPRAVVEGRARFGDILHIQIGGYEVDLPLVPTYGRARPRELLATYSSSGFLEIARREGRAADHLGAEPDTPVSVRHR